jgi:predicted DNA binding CopG/RHH family protein
LIDAYERGEFRRAKDQTKARAEAVQAARRSVHKDARINVRLASADLKMGSSVPSRK